ncbi:helix-turn-helix transcriptional regulator [Streptomyces sp. 150FB]|uniref:helix-turn-helix domain-containing protein n=1 Tax=Streptomyces sp. 150FB TaxID=1576605 RepID=UPI0007C6734F|nr:helix-turn-helix transcriptional regulator [Streptomyces sp. 150FB]
MPGRDFGDSVRWALQARGMSIRAASRALSYDHAYLSRVLAGKQLPSPELLASLDQLLGTDWSARRDPAAAPENDFSRSAVTHLLEHDNRHGGNHVASAAVQVWRAEQKKLNGENKRHLSAVAELAEISGWLLFDANRQDEARAALVESQMLAKIAGDGPLEWFALDLLAMHSVHNGSAGEALSISDEILTRPGIPNRVALMSQVRRARALAQAGDRARALDAMERATGAMQDSAPDREPAWTWWIDDAEITGHYGELWLSLGDGKAALPHLERAAEVEHGGGRRKLGHLVALLTGFVSVQAWRESEKALLEIFDLLDIVTSARSRERLKETLRGIRRDAPQWLADLADETAKAQLRTGD